MHIVLVHGAMADGYMTWSKIIPLLKAAGHIVVAVQLPLTSIPDDVAVVKTAIKTIENGRNKGPIVVVGHSFSGVTITNATHDAMNVVALVYVFAFAPDEGETVAAFADKFPPLPSNQKFVADATGRISLSESDYIEYFAPDLPREEAAVLASCQGPTDMGRFGFVSGPPAWKEGKKLYYIVADNDQILGADQQLFLGQRMNAAITHLHGASHGGLISQPKAVADVILEAASS